MSSKELTDQGYTYAVVKIHPQEVESGPAASTCWASQQGLDGFASLGTSAADERGKRTFNMPGTYFVEFHLYLLMPGPEYIKNSEKQSAGFESVGNHFLGNCPVSSVAYKVQVVRPSLEHADECMCTNMPKQAWIGRPFSLDLELCLDSAPIDLANCSFKCFKLHSKYLNCR